MDSKVYLVALKDGGMARIKADTYVRDEGARFYLGLVLHSKFWSEYIREITEENRPQGCVAEDASLRHELTARRG